MSWRTAACLTVVGVCLLAALPTAGQEPSVAPGWGQSKDRTLETYYRMGPFLTDGDRLLMLGRRFDPYRGVSFGGDVLATQDGMAWGIDSILIPTPLTMTGFERTDAGWVVVGSTPSGSVRDGGVPEPVAWLSHDYESWRPAAWEELVLTADGYSQAPADAQQVLGEMTGLAAGPAGLVAIGRYWCEEPVPLGPDGATERVAIWRSDTGESWTRVPWGDGLPRAEVIGVVRDRYLIAGPDGFWVSADGSSWSPLEVDTDGAIILGIAEGPDVAVILGVDHPSGVGRVTTWTSRDGLAWTAHDPTKEIDPFQLERLRRIGDRFAIVGSGDGLWWSSDGETWEADPIPWAGVVWDIGWLAGRAVLGGQHGIIGEALVRDLAP